jgi:hypothetical protein
MKKWDAAPTGGGWSGSTAYTRRRRPNIFLSSEMPLNMDSKPALRSISCFLAGLYTMAGNAGVFVFVFLFFLFFIAGRYFRV